METLFEKIGGAESVEQLVTAFYQRVLADPLISHFFADTEIEKLKRMQIAFFSIALGGGEPDTMSSLSEVHRGRGIERQHLTRFTELLIETLEEIGINPDDSKRVYERIALYSGSVLGDVGEDG